MESKLAAPSVAAAVTAAAAAAAAAGERGREPPAVKMIGKKLRLTDVSHCCL